MTRRIPHSRPWISDSDLASIGNALRSEMIAQGDLTARFERELSAWVGARPAGVAAASGSAAIVLALRALEVGAGDDVVLPSYLCPKVVEAVLAVGAVPRFSDVGPWWMVEPDDVAAVITPRTRALILPHLVGIVADLSPFRAFGVPIIEDAAQALGDRGAHPIQGDIAVFSFHPTKALTTGEGGMAVTQRLDLADAMRELRDGAPGASAGRVFAPLSDLGAALGLSQLERYPQAMARRREIAARYRAALEPIHPEYFDGFPWDRSVFFRFPLKVRGGASAVQPAFEAAGIRVTNAIDALVHRSRGIPDSEFPVSTFLFDHTVSLPIYPALGEDELSRAIEVAVALLAGPAGAGVSAPRVSRRPA